MVSVWGGISSFKLTKEARWPGGVGVRWTRRWPGADPRGGLMAGRRWRRGDLLDCSGRRGGVELISSLNYDREGEKMEEEEVKKKAKEQVMSDDNKKIRSSDDEDGMEMGMKTRDLIRQAIITPNPNHHLKEDEAAGVKEADDILAFSRAVHNTDSSLH
nr:hypothetical protein Saspl_012641 [Ipomoea batatas]